MVILTLNFGSSSAKYQVYDWANRDVLAIGIVERVTLGGSFIVHRPKGKDEIEKNHDCPDHREAVKLIIDTLTDPQIGVIHDMGMIKAVGHRVLHGGNRFTKSVIVNDEVIKAFKEVEDLGPLHNPANIMGIEAARKVLPQVPHCAIMDTAWHQSMPEFTYRYAVPTDWYKDLAVRRYGFHGTSFLYTAKRAAALLGKDPFKTNLIIAHIGNGSSINAVKNGSSYDTSMGITPLEGLVMGTRSGDIDPALPLYVMRKTGMTVQDIDTALNKKSGLCGLTGGLTDRRDIQAAVEKGNKEAELAQDIEAYRVKKYIGAYMAALGRVDALVFTAGVGEMAPYMRDKFLQGLEGLGIVYDPEKNKIAKTRNAETLISKPESKIPVYIIPTDEELVMTEDAWALMNGSYDVHTDFSYSFQKPEYVNKSREEALLIDIEKNHALAEIVVRPPTV